MLDVTKIPSPSHAREHRGLALIVVVIFITLFLALSIQLSVQSRTESRLTAARRLNVMYEGAAKIALAAVQSDLETHFVPNNSVTSGSDDFNVTDIHFSSLLNNVRTGDPWAEEYGVDYKMFGTNTLPGLQDYDATHWLVPMNNDRIEVLVRVFVKNNRDDPSVINAGNIAQHNGQDIPYSENFDIDGKILVTAVAFLAPPMEPEPVAILTGTVAPDPDFTQQQYSRPAGNQGLNNNRGWDGQNANADVVGP
jgi:type II secretory pathway pseudopilin PulG